MAAEIETREPRLENISLMEKVRRENLGFIDMASTEETEKVFLLVKAAIKIAPIVLDLPENQGKTGFVLVISHDTKGYPDFTVQIGNVTAPDPEYGLDGKLGKYVIYAKLKAKVLKDHPRFICSSQNHLLPKEQRIRTEAGNEIPSGAIEADGKLISISAFNNPDMDAATALMIPVVAKVGQTLDQARYYASDMAVDCRRELEEIISASEQAGLEI